MEKDEDLKRNRPSDKDEKNDPVLRDEDASQPGASTISRGENDEANQHLTKTASDNFSKGIKDPNADKRFDE